MTSEIEIKTYSPEYRDDFVRLNKEWIKTYFKLEKSDFKTFDHVEYIVQNGGQIFFAIDKDVAAVVGCCALVKRDDKNCFELAKMAVSKDYRGHHIGRKLGDALIDYAKKHNVKRIFLEGNTKLEASIALYKRLGFKEIPLQRISYERCDILMEKIIP